MAIAEAVGIELDVDNSKKLAESLDNATRAGNPYFNKLLRILSTRWVIRKPRRGRGRATVVDNERLVCTRYLLPVL